MPSSSREIPSTRRDRPLCRSDCRGDSRIARKKARKPTATPLQGVIGQLKSYTTKRYREITGNKTDKLWQRGFYDRIIREEAEFQRAWEYIEYNALKNYSSG